MKNFLNIAQKFGFGLFTIVLLNILSGIFLGKIFFSVFISFWIFTIGLALVVYPAVLNKRNEDSLCLETSDCNSQLLLINNKFLTW